MGSGRMVPFELLAPGSEAEAIRAVADGAPGSVAVLAGGTDLLIDLEERRVEPRVVVSLRRLPWGGHRWEDGDGCVIGSTEPLAALEADPALASRLPALYQAVVAVGSPALREQATLGGNLGRCAPASDLTPVLLALDAAVELVGPAGNRSMAVDELLLASRRTALGRGELIRAVRIPEGRPVSAYLWQRVRPANDISQIGIAVAYSSRDGRWRISLGGVPARPLLVDAAAGCLHGPRPAPPDIAAASARLAADPALVGDRRATDEHRRRLAGVLVERAVAQATAAAGAPR